MIEYSSQKFHIALEVPGRVEADRILELFANIPRDTQFDPGFTLEEYYDNPVVLQFNSTKYRANINDLIEFLTRCCQSVKLAGLLPISWSYDFEVFREGGCAGGACIMELESGLVIERIDLFEWIRLHAGPKKETSSLMLAWELREEMGRMDAILERLENEIRQERASMRNRTGSSSSCRHSGKSP